jgi:very-short-patch-repair endonuclease/predicted transcriptional regulator of viral defense system
MTATDHVITRFAARQYGLVSRSQLLGAGVTPAKIAHRFDTGHLDRVFKGVYRVAGSQHTWHTDLMAALLYCGPGSALSHRTAARMHGLLRLPELVELCTPRRRRARDLPEKWVIPSSIVFPMADLIEVGGLTCTTVERTLIDLGAVVPERRVGHAVEQALKSEQTDLPMLTYVHQRRRGRGRRGAGVLAAVLDGLEDSDRADSPLERDFLSLIRRSGLPLPKTQQVIDNDGRFIARVDFLWPDHDVIVEVDGHEYHSTRDQRSADSSRQNRLTALGYTVFRFTSDQVRSSRIEVVSTVRHALGLDPFL